MDTCYPYLYKKIWSFSKRYSAYAQEVSPAFGLCNVSGRIQTSPDIMANPEIIPLPRSPATTCQSLRKMVDLQKHFVVRQTDFSDGKKIYARLTNLKWFLGHGSIDSEDRYYTPLYWHVKHFQNRLLSHDRVDVPDQLTWYFPASSPHELNPVATHRKCIIDRKFDDNLVEKYQSRLLHRYSYRKYCQNIILQGTVDHRASLWWTTFFAIDGKFFDYYWHTK